MPGCTYMGVHGWVAGIASHGSMLLFRGWLITKIGPLVWVSKIRLSSRPPALQNNASPWSVGRGGGKLRWRQLRTDIINGYKVITNFAPSSFDHSADKVCMITEKKIFLSRCWKSPEEEHLPYLAKHLSALRVPDTVCPQLSADPPLSLHFPEPLALLVS